MNNTKSEKLFEEACKYIPGGVNSPVRAFKSVGMNPLFIARGEGAYIYDEDGNKFLDFISSWGPLLVGHAHPEIVEAITETVKNGTSFGACNSKEVDMAKAITDLFPSIDMVRMVNSGTEATMSAIRLARGYTSKDKIVKFEGCYHGHADSFLIKAGSGLATFSVPGSNGVTSQTASNTLVALYNDIASVERVLDANKNEVAAVIIEPVMGNMGVVNPNENFLKELREVCTKNGVLLIFDEVITGFRLSSGGAQKFYGVNPDLTCLGKIIGGGLPVGAFGGRKDIMNMLSPNGPVYQAGTLSGNPLALAAGLAMLKQLARPGFYDEMEEKAVLFEAMVKKVLVKYGDKLSYNRSGSLSTIFFKAGGVHSCADSAASDTERYAIYFREMLKQNIYIAPSQFEAMFLSGAHTIEELEMTAKAIENALEVAMK